jgi:hypothetical protein
LAKGKNSRPHDEDRLLNDFNMSGCTHIERLSMVTLQRTTQLASAFDTAMMDERVSLDNRTAGFPLYLSTPQLKHSLRMPVGDSLRLSEGTSVKFLTDEDACLKGRDLLSVQFCLDAVLHNDKFIDWYSISPQAHHSEGMSMGSDHRQTTALSLTTRMSKYNRINISAELGTHLINNPGAGGFFQITEEVPRHSACLALSSGVREKSFLAVDNKGAEGLKLGAPGVKFREFTKLWAPQQDSDSPLAECLDIIVAQLANPCSQDTNRKIWAVTEIISSWMVSQGRPNEASRSALCFRGVVPEAYKLEFTHRWKAKLRK